MDIDASTYQDAAGQPRYARFSRRFRAMFIDTVIVLVSIFGAVFIAVTVRQDNFSRVLGTLVVLALVLYEPILVSRFGGTVGHYLTNLRVVDQRTGGNVGFLTALARMIIKGVLGLYSFVVMAATRRNQAVHDLLTRSTVQIRDPAKASRHQYVTERLESAAADMPSGLRRTAVICIYLVLMFAIHVGIFAGLTASGALSRQCLNSNFCSAGERFLMIAEPLMLLAASTFCIVWGWRGRLIGARRKVVSYPPSARQ